MSLVNRPKVGKFSGVALRARGGQLEGDSSGVHAPLKLVDLVCRSCVTLMGWGRVCRVERDAAGWLAVDGGNGAVQYSDNGQGLLRSIQNTNVVRYDFSKVPRCGLSLLLTLTLSSVQSPSLYIPFKTLLLTFCLFLSLTYILFIQSFIIIQHLNFAIEIL